MPNPTARFAVPVALGILLLAVAVAILVSQLSSERKTPDRPEPSPARKPTVRPVASSEKGAAPPEDADDAASPLPIDPPEEEEEETDRYDPAVPLSGRVLTADGHPIAGATVRWAIRRTLIGGYLFTPERTTTTDAFGRFAFPAVVPNDGHIRGYIEARAPGFRPDGRDIPGRPQEVVFHLAATPSLSIRGRVVDAESGEPVADAEIHVETIAEFDEEIQGHSDTDGRFEAWIATTFEGGLDSGFAPDSEADVSIDVWAAHADFYVTEKAQIRAPSLEALAGQTVDGIEIAMAKTCALRFGVFDETTQKPLPGASITVELEATDDGPSVSASGSTGARGEARLTGLRPGRGRATASAPGYLERTLDLDLTGTELEALSLSLYRGGVVTGRVVGPDGESVAGATVRITVPTEPMEKPPAGAEGREVETDGDGRFRIDGLPGYAEYVLCVGGGRFRPALVEGVRVETGEVTVDIVIPLDEGAAIAGVVRDADNLPVAASIRVDTVRETSEDKQESEDESEPPSEAAPPDDCPSDPDRWWIPVDADGHYWVTGLPPGRYRVAARGQGRIPPPARTVTLDDGEVRDRVDFTFGVAVGIGRGVTLTGRVTDVAGGPISRSRVSVYCPAGGWLDARTGDDGAFRLDGLPTGPFTLTAAKRGFEPNRVGGELPSAPLHVVLEGLARLRGRMVRPDGSGAEGDILGARWKPPLGWLYFHNEGHISKTGWFDIAVPPGDLAFVFLAPRNVPKPGVPSYARVRRDFHIAPGEVRDVTIVIGPSGSVVCRVVDGATGAPVPKARVALYDGTGRRLDQFLNWLSTAEMALGYAGEYTRDDGTHHFEVIEPGEVVVAAWHPERGPARARLRVDAGREHQVILKLPGGNGIHGILERWGAPLPGVRLRIVRTEEAETHIVRTEADGSFVAADLDPGAYDIVTDVDGAPRRLARVVSVSPGRWARVRLETASTLLFGRVLGAAGNPVPGVDVVRFSMREGTILRGPSTTDAEGRYALPLYGTGYQSVQFGRKENGEWRGGVEIIAIPPGVEEWEQDLLLP